MKAIIWIIVLGLAAWGVWYFMSDKSTINPTSYGNNAGQVEGASDAYNPDGTLKVDGSMSTEVDVKG